MNLLTKSLFLHIARIGYTLQWIFMMWLVPLWLTSCGIDGLSDERTNPSKEERKFAGVFRNQSNPPGHQLNDELLIDYPYLGSVEATHIELNSNEIGLQAISYQGNVRRSSRTLFSGQDYRFSNGTLVFPNQSSTYENHFFLTNIDRKSTTFKTVGLDKGGDLVISFTTNEAGTNWLIPTFGSSNYTVTFERIR